MDRRNKVAFTSAGNTLAGALEQPAGQVRGYALFAHCFTCGKDIAAASRIARELTGLGFAVLRFDFTGLGGSDGDFANTNFSSNVDDLVAAADFLREQYQAPSVLIGHSLGGRAVLSAAKRIPESKAVVTIGAPADADHVMKQFAGDVDAIRDKGESSVLLAGRPFTIKKQFIEDIEQGNDDIERLGKALLVMHSPIDTVVSVEQAEKIYRRAKHPKSYISLDKANHLLTDKADASYVAGMIAAWASKFIPEPEQEDKVSVNKGEVIVGEVNKQFTRSVASDTHQWIADEPAGIGDDLGPDPYEHLLAALGACTSMTLRMYANRKKIKLDNVDVRLRHSREHSQDCEDVDSKSCKIEVIEREVDLQGDLSEEQRASLLAIADKCPVHKTLESDIVIRTALGEP